MAKIITMAKALKKKNKEAGTDKFLAAMADEMTRAAEEGDSEAVAEIVADMTEGLETMRKDAGISDVPMNAGPGLKAFMNPADEKEIEGRYVLFSGEKNGIGYFFESEVSFDEEVGEAFFELFLLRTDGNGTLERYAGAGMWIEVDEPEYELPAEESVTALAGKGEGEAKILEAFMNAEGRYPSEHEARRLLMRNGDTARLIDESGCGAAVELVGGKAKAFLSSKGGEGLTFESAGAGRFLVGTALQAWSEDVPDAPELTTDVRIRMTYEETLETVRKAMRTKFFMPFSKGEAFAPDYDPFEEAKRAKEDLEALAEKTKDASAAAEMKKVAEYAARYGRA